MNELFSRPTYQKEYKTSEAFDNGSRLVLGTSGLGGVWGGIQLEESVETILYALENGVNVFDTAPSYAEAEIVLGRALRQWSGDLPTISTKIGRLKAPDAHTTKTDYSTDALTRSFDKSLQLIGVDHVDILFLHEPQLVNARDISRILELMQSFVEQGTVGRLGLGGNLTSAFKPYMGKGKFEVVSGFLRMNACNLEAFPADVEFLKKNSVAYYNASILHFALLGERLSRYKVNFEKEKSWLKKSDLNRAERLLDVSKKYQLPMSSLAFRYAMGIKEADRIVMGAKNKAQLLQSLKDWEEGPLPLNLFEEITDLAISKSEVEIDRVLK